MAESPRGDPTKRAGSLIGSLLGNWRFSRPKLRPAQNQLKAAKLSRPRCNYNAKSETGQQLKVHFVEKSLGRGQIGSAKPLGKTTVNKFQEIACFLRTCLSDPQSGEDCRRPQFPG